MWLLQIWIMLLGIHLSTQDMVTISPSEPVTENSPTTETPRPKPTIRSLHINSDIEYRYATTLVSSRVVNPSDQAAEAAFFVTLPESAFISDFLMEVKGKVYKAYVKEKKEAKAEYDQAVQAGQFAGHVALDARDSNQFTVSVNVEAHGKVTFNLTYEQLLSRNQGVYKNVININPQQIVNDMSVTVNIKEPTAITLLDVPELQISNEAIPEKTKQNTLAKIEEISPKERQVVWAPTPEQQKIQNATGISGQFIVKYDVDREENPQQILVDEGYFVHFFAPENLPKLKKHVIFVLDYSGSMAGRKLDQLKDAMNKILSDLEPKDYFSIVIFQSFIEAWSPKNTYSTAVEYLSQWEKDRIPETSVNTTLDKEFVVEASPTNIDLARSYIDKYSDLGATNIMGGLRTGLKLVDIGSEKWANESDPPQPVIVFLTDGQPNVEEYDTNVIINKTKTLNSKECPIFSLAFGYGADYNFLRKMSLSNNGFARNIYEAADASEQLKNFYQTVASPLLSNVTFTYLPDQVDNSTNTKKEFPVFFKGSELVVAGKINKDSLKDNKTIGELSGVTANGPYKHPIVINIILKPENRTLGHLEKSWAYLTIQQLLDKIDSLDDGNEKNETKAKALQTALQYSFVTPLTSLVVVKPNETESAVDTTKVKPGSGELGYGPVGFGAGGASSGFIMNGAPQLALAASYPIPPAAPGAFMFSRPSASIAHGYSIIAPQRRLMYNAPRGALHPYSYTRKTQRLNGGSQDSMNKVQDITTPYYHEEATTEADKETVTLNDIKWLNLPEVSNSSSSSNVTVDIQGHNYYVALNEADQSFGECQVNGTSGECRHLQHCPLKVFQDKVSEFIPYKCPITGDYLGVCCPEHTN